MGDKVYARDLEQVRESALKEAAAVLDPYINGQRGPWSAYDIKEEIESLITRPSVAYSASWFRVEVICEACKKDETIYEAN